LHRQILYFYKAKYKSNTLLGFGKTFSIESRKNAKKLEIIPFFE